jgi:hypothetical protein
MLLMFFILANILLRGMISPAASESLLNSMCIIKLGSLFSILLVIYAETMRCEV